MFVTVTVTVPFNPRRRQKWRRRRRRSELVTDSQRVTWTAFAILAMFFPYVAPTNVWIKNQNVSENLMRWRRRRNVKLWQKPPFWSSQQCVGLQLSHNISQQALAGCTWRPTAWFETHAGAKAWFEKKSFGSRAAPSRCKTRCIYSGCGNSCKQTNNKKNIPTQNRGY